MSPSLENMTPWCFHQQKGKGSTPRFFIDGLRATSENDAYLWTMADLMTLLLIFFIMLYVNAIQPEPAPVEPPAESAADAREVTPAGPGVLPKAASVAPESAAAEVSDQSPPPVLTRESITPSTTNPAMEALNRQIAADLEDRFNRDFYVRWNDRKPVIVLGERIAFNRGEAILLSDAEPALKRVAGLILKLGNCQVVVSGHTDDLPIRTREFPSNWELSAARAASVAKALMAHGVLPQQLLIQGQSEFDPLLANTSEENRRTNRRVEISLSEVKALGKQ